MKMNLTITEFKYFVWKMSFIFTITDEDPALLERKQYQVRYKAAHTVHMLSMNKTTVLLSLNKTKQNEPLLIMQKQATVHFGHPTYRIQIAACLLYEIKKNNKMLYQFD